MERLLAVLLVVVVSLAGAACGGGGDGGGGDDTSEEGPATDEGGDDGGGGGGDGGGGPGAVVSPHRIPAIEQKGAPIGDVRDSIEGEFVDACDGELCVDLVEVDANGGTVTDECVFSRTNPPEGTEVARGSTVTLVVRCEAGGAGGNEDGTTTTEDGGP